MTTTILTEFIANDRKIQTKYFMGIIRDRQSFLIVDDQELLLERDFYRNGVHEGHQEWSYSPYTKEYYLHVQYEIHPQINPKHEVFNYHEWHQNGQLALVAEQVIKMVSRERSCRLQLFRGELKQWHENGQMSYLRTRGQSITDPLVLAWKKSIGESESETTIMEWNDRGTLIEQRLCVDDQDRFFWSWTDSGKPKVYREYSKTGEQTRIRIWDENNVSDFIG